MKKNHTSSSFLQEEEIGAFFDRCFDQGLFRGFDAEEYERTLYLLDKFEIQEGWRIFEPGCGCGRLTRLLAERVGDKGMIEACELSSRMIEYCLKGDFPERVRFSRASALDLELLPDSLDAVICFNVWPHFMKPEAHLSRFERLLKAGGALYICHSCGRLTINAIHQNKPDDVIYSHLLSSGEDMENFLFGKGWKTLEKIDADKLYYIKAVKHNSL